MTNLNIKNLKLNEKDLLNEESLKGILGGQIDGGYNCYCNGHYLGVGATPLECAAKCQVCEQCW